MADFNAFPAMGIKGPDIAPAPDLANIFSNVEKVKAMQNENALAPMRAQAMAQQNALQGMAVQQMQQANQYAGVERQLRTIAQQFDGDPKGAEAAWNQVMSSFPEGKQWGEISGAKLEKAIATYGGQATQAAGRARGAYATALKQADGLNTDVLGQGALPGGGGGNAFGGGGEPFTGSQVAGFSDLSPQQTMVPVEKFHEADRRLQEIADSKDPKAQWEKEQRDHPDFPRDPYSKDNFDALRASIDARRAQMAGLEQNAQLGIPNPRAEQKAVGNNVFDPFTGKITLAPENAETVRKNKENEAIQWDEHKIQKERFAAEYGTASPTDLSRPQPNPNAKSIGNQTGLSNMAITWLTDPGKVPQGTRARVDREVDDYLRKNDIDTVNFKSLWKSFGDSAEQNTMRFTQTKIMEHELLGTLDNLKSSTEAAELGSFRLLNVGKIMAGQEANSPQMQKVQQQMNQLRSELIAYNVATRASKGGQNRVTDIDKEEAENTIKAGFAAGSITGLRDAISDSTKKMGAVLHSAIDDADRGKWELLGKGDNYDKTHPEAAERAKAIGEWGGGREGNAISDPGAEAILRSRGMKTESSAPAAPALKPGADLGGGFTFKETRP